MGVVFTDDGVLFRAERLRARLEHTLALHVAERHETRALGYELGYAHSQGCTTLV